MRKRDLYAFIGIAAAAAFMLILNETTSLDNLKEFGFIAIIGGMFIGRGIGSKADKQQNA